MLKKLQHEHYIWARINFGRIDYIENLMGVVEEVGELFHAALKEKQGVRINEDHEAKAQDAIGDIVIYLAGVCSSRGWSFENTVQNVWDNVQKRDWKKHPEEGVPFE